MQDIHCSDPYHSLWTVNSPVRIPVIPQSGRTVLEALAYCVFPLPSKENKKPLYFLSSKFLSLFLFGMGAQGAKIWQQFLFLAKHEGKSTNSGVRQPGLHPRSTREALGPWAGDLSSPSLRCLICKDAANIRLDNPM